VDLLSPFQLGPLTLPNRVIMSPMTRSRAVGANVPNPLSPTYYAQRASAGLIITEGAQVSPQGVGYYYTPGIHSAEQVAGWKAVTDAVHHVGGRIFLQLWHVGRISHPGFHDGALPVAPSALTPDAHVYTPEGLMPVVTPRALDLSELPGIVEQFRQGAENAKAAGFDGVELHGSNGYLLDQFLRDSSNQRTDAYGGSVANRARLPLDVTDAVVSVWGADRVGYQVSPSFTYLSMADSQPVETFGYLALELSRRKLAYLHVSEPVSGPLTPVTPIAPVMRSLFRGPLILNGGYDPATGNLAIASGQADMIAYGALFLANPDLPERFRRGGPLNVADPATYHGGDERGYTDYPTLAER
jgi:N-ethylmaleimide reductase